MAHDLPLPPPPVSLGEIVAGKYRVERVLGTGAMGYVVSARHVALDQVVAIKMLVEHRFGGPAESVQRFLGEARAAARIDSDHVCRVFDVGTLPNGVPYMVMEYLEGNDLEIELHRRGQLEIAEAVDYVLQAADAMAAAHQLGIIHRDLKPSNLFLTTRADGSRRVKVLDFGISKGAFGSVRVTREAGSLGTPAYMSPEQIRDPMHVDARTDIWALGAILYEALTGQTAFVGDSVKAVLDMVLEEDPCPLASLRRELPFELTTAVMRALERDRDKRWPSAGVFARVLAPYASMGMVNQLASIQREIGSVRTTPAAPSVEPMVANVPREALQTQPDTSEIISRASIVQEWSMLRARARLARFVLVGLTTMFFVVLGGIVIVKQVAKRGTLATAAAEQAPPAVLVPDEPPDVVPAAAPPLEAPGKNVQVATNSVQSARSAPEPKTKPPATRAAAAPAAKPPAKAPAKLLDSRE